MRQGGKLSEEEQATWDELIKVWMPVDAGFFYCPYIPIMVKRKELGYGEIDVS